MKTHKLTIYLSASMEVRIPDDATPQQIREAAEKVLRRCERRYQSLSLDESRWDDDDPPEPSMRVPEDGWFRFNGHDWCTDRSHTVRRGTPHRLLVNGWDGWLTGASRPTARDVRAVMKGTQPVHGVAYCCRSFLPVLRAGTLVRLGGPADPVRVEVDGEPVALVMPIRVPNGENGGNLLQVLEDGTLVVPGRKIELGGWR